jgi:hypothetical protein
VIDSKPADLDLPLSRHQRDGHRLVCVSVLVLEELVQREPHAGLEAALLAMVPDVLQAHVGAGELAPSAPDLVVLGRVDVHVELDQLRAVEPDPVHHQYLLLDRLGEPPPRHPRPPHLRSHRAPPQRHREPDRLQRADGGSPPEPQRHGELGVDPLQVHVLVRVPELGHVTRRACRARGPGAPPRRRRGRRTRASPGP